MEQKFLLDTWHMWTDKEKVAIIDTLRALVAIDEKADDGGES